MVFLQHFSAMEGISTDNRKDVLGNHTSSLLFSRRSGGYRRLHILAPPCWNRSRSPAWYPHLRLRFDREKGAALRLFPAFASLRFLLQSCVVCCNCGKNQEPRNMVFLINARVNLVYPVMVTFLWTWKNRPEGRVYQLIYILWNINAHFVVRLLLCFNARVC